jgi:hypothetical protein
MDHTEPRKDGEVTVGADVVISTRVDGPVGAGANPALNGCRAAWLMWRKHPDCLSPEDVEGAEVAIAGARMALARRRKGEGKDKGSERITVARRQACPPMWSRGACAAMRRLDEGTNAKAKREPAHSTRSPMAFCLGDPS